MKTYKALKKNIFSDDCFSLVPIRYADRIKIMNWRNEQIYHLRQSKVLTEDDQEKFFAEIIPPLFNQKQPDQILFSFLKHKKCIGYGGLVHLNWIDKNAEISFIMNTKLEKVNFQNYWKVFMNLIEEVAFADLKLNKISTYAYDLRPKLYPVLDELGFIKEAVLKNHCLLDSKYIDVIIHSKFKEY